MKFSPIVNVIDVECTCWEPPSAKPTYAISEIIEIGVAVVDINEFKILENHALMVRPQKSEVSEFCERLTSLNRYDLMSGQLFQSAVQELENTFKTKDRLFVSWGDYDRKMFESNCETYNCPYPFGPRHLNLRNVFTMLHSLKSEPSINEALALIGSHFNGREHRGVDDSRNIAEILISVLKIFRGNAK
jgi:inhibitor of KinA sporulation pathway (predicted exonuclease)